MNYQLATNLGVGAGILLQFLGGFLIRAGQGGPMTVVGGILQVLSIPCYLYGCINYAWLKNYDWYVGLLGLLGCCGLLVMVLLPHQPERSRSSGRRKKKKRPRYDDEDDEDDYDDEPRPRKRRRRRDDEDDEDY